MRSLLWLSFVRRPTDTLASLSCDSVLALLSCDPCDIAGLKVPDRAESFTVLRDDLLNCRRESGLHGH